MYEKVLIEFKDVDFEYLTSKTQPNGLTILLQTNNVQMKADKLYIYCRPEVQASTACYQGHY